MLPFTWNVPEQTNPETENRLVVTRGWGKANGAWQCLFPEWWKHWGTIIDRCTFHCTILWMHWMPLYTLKSAILAFPAVTTSLWEHASQKALSHLSPEDNTKHKKKHLVQSSNSYFMDVKCLGCYTIITVFSHAQTVVLCVGCSTVFRQPTGGKARLIEGCSCRRK